MALRELHPQECITEGLPRDEALRIYAASVNKDDTLFTFLPTLPAKLAQMRELLHDPITVDETCALNDVLYRRRKYVDMIAWLQDEPVTWDGYFVRERFRAEEADRKLTKYLQREDEDRKKGIGKYASKLSPEKNARQIARAKSHYLRFAHPCPQCSTPAEFLEWSRWSSPPSDWRHISSGWQTHCTFCLEKVDSFIGLMGTGRRPTLPGVPNPSIELRKRIEEAIKMIPDWDADDTDPRGVLETPASEHGNKMDNGFLEKLIERMEELKAEGRAQKPRSKLMRRLCRKQSARR
jgi:hypothetical protein